MTADPSFVLSWMPRIDVSGGVSGEVSGGVSGAALVFEYRLENRGTQDVWALDVLMVFGVDGFAINAEETIVLEDAKQAGRVWLKRGSVQAVRSFPEIELRPVARRLGAGAAVEGRGRTPWPLRNHHPNEGFWPLSHEAHEAVLEVGVLPGHCALEQLPLVGGGVATVPRPSDAFQFQQFVRATPFVLPGTPTGT